MAVAARFDAFVAALHLTPRQLTDGNTKQSGVRKCLNVHYWGLNAETANSMLVGSWGKSTQIRPPRDVDVLFQLPKSVYDRFQSRGGNGQSALLQEVKDVLAVTYPTTSMRADGQVVVVPFESYGVEVVPAFQLTDGKYWICDTNEGGRYSTIDPIGEAADIAAVDTLTNGNARRLIRMLKRWQATCSVPMKSFWLEVAATFFLRHWRFSDKTSVYHDWMIRDFFAFILQYGGGFVRLPNMTEWQPLGWEWVSRARTAFATAAEACRLEAGNYVYAAGDEWQKIFGPDMPTR